MQAAGDNLRRRGRCTNDAASTHVNAIACALLSDRGIASNAATTTLLWFKFCEMIQHAHMYMHCSLQTCSFIVACVGEAQSRKN